MFSSHRPSFHSAEHGLNILLTIARTDTQGLHQLAWRRTLLPSSPWKQVTQLMTATSLPDSEKHTLTWTAMQAAIYQTSPRKDSPRERRLTQSCLCRYQCTCMITTGTGQCETPPTFIMKNREFMYE